MKIIGEKLNSSIKVANALMQARDEAAIIKLANAQIAAGADYIDINAGAFVEKECEILAFMASVLSREKIPLSIDTLSYKASRVALEAARATLEAANSPRHLINSITLEQERLENMTSLALEYDCSVVALCMSNSPTPKSIESKIEIAGQLVSYLTEKGIKAEDIFIDPMLRPLGADENSGVEAFEAIRRIKNYFPECNIICGLSNLSYGMPQREIINRAFVVSAICNGLNSAILDPLDKELMSLISAAEAIQGIDKFGIDYIKKCRDGII